MNAIYAKQPFTSKTISEVFNHISTMFNVKLPYNNEYQSEWHKFNDFIERLSSSEISYVDSQLEGQLALLKYQVAIFGIFVERLLNKRWKLTSNNLQEEQQILYEIIGFFRNWNSANEETNKKNKVSKSIGEKICIAKKTNYNLISLVYGFLGYAKKTNVCIILKSS